LNSKNSENSKFGAWKKFEFLDFLELNFKNSKFEPWKNSEFLEFSELDSKNSKFFRFSKF